MSVHSCPIQRSSPKYDWVDERDIADLAAYDKTVPIMVQASNGAIDDPSELNNLYKLSADGRLIA
jgi:multidrug efflux pump subunit AcrB